MVELFAFSDYSNVAGDDRMKKTQAFLPYERMCSIQYIEVLI